MAATLWKAFSPAMRIRLRNCYLPVDARSQNQGAQHPALLSRRVLRPSHPCRIRQQAGEEATSTALIVVCAAERQRFPAFSERQFHYIFMKNRVRGTFL